MAKNINKTTLGKTFSANSESMVSSATEDLKKIIIDDSTKKSIQSKNHGLKNFSLTVTPRQNKNSFEVPTSRPFQFAIEAIESLGSSLDIKKVSVVENGSGLIASHQTVNFVPQTTIQELNYHHLFA